MKPCPFCGSKSGFRVLKKEEDEEGIPAAIVCENCGACGPWKCIPKEIFRLVEDDMEALAAMTGWNRAI